MSASRTVGSTKVPWVDVLLSAVAAVSWALIGMAGTAALGLHLLEADTAGSLGPMTAAVVALGAGGSVTPSGDVSAFGLTGAEATTAIEITPLGVSLVGALLLSWFFLRSLRAAGVVIAPAELAARAGAVVALSVAMLGGLAWAGDDVVTLDGRALGLDELPGGGGGGGVEIPGLGDVGDIGGLLPDQIGDLIDAEAAVGFTVDTAPTLLGGACWSAGILLIALLASRRTPLPAGWAALHRVVRPAVSALVGVLLMAVLAGFAAAAYALTGDDNPKRIAGAALLGAPNGVWLGIPIGLFVPWDGEATGPLAQFLPDPLDDLLVDSDHAVTLGRMAELDGRVWLLGVAAAMAMLLAGVLTAVRTPVVRGWGNLGFAGRCALRLGIVTALALPLLAWLTEVSVDASLAVLGVDAFDAGVELHGQLGPALLLGAAWGAAAGATGALLARATGAAGQRAAPLALGDVGVPGAEPARVGDGPWEGGGTTPGRAGEPGWDRGGAPGRAGPAAGHASGAAWQAGGAARQADGAGGPADRAAEQGAGAAGQASGTPGRSTGAPGDGPYAPGVPYRPPNPGTNPYLRVPGELREPEDAPPERAGAEEAGRSGEDVYGAPTVVRPIDPPPRSGRRSSSGGSGEGPPPPPPPPPPAPPRGPKGRR
ncbi:streptophobe family protein [Streptomyces sp. NPDC057798]|uniref:streptophobe family protein n=1 Tax=Streptomyces sp. NPDC057798 TaxID=3346252 RepID=UPI0036BE100D